MSFRQIRIRNFRGISRGEIKELERFNVIIGLNNAGKTSLLEALYLLASAELEPPGFSDSIELLAYLHGEQGSLKHSFLFHFYNIFVPIEIEEVDGIRRIELRYEDGRIVKKITGTPQRALFMSSKLLRKYISYIEKNWPRISTNRDVVLTLAEILHYDVNSYTVEKYLPRLSLDGDTLYVVRSDNKKVRFMDLGEGLQMYIVARLLYEYLKPELILWDIIEDKMEPWLLAKTVAWFTELPGQVVVTTNDLKIAKDIVEALKANCLVIDTRHDKLFVGKVDDIGGYIDIGLDPRAIMRADPSEFTDG